MALALFSAPAGLPVILHIDLDCFYAQVEALRIGVSLDEPFGVSQWGSILAVSYSARNFGISRMDNVQEAMRKCPAFKWCHTATYAAGDEQPHYYPALEIRRETHKVSLATYREASRKIFAVLKSFDADALEKGGTDEAYMNVTSLAVSQVNEILQQVRKERGDDEEKKKKEEEEEHVDDIASLKHAAERVALARVQSTSLILSRALCAQRELQMRDKLEQEQQMGVTAMHQHDGDDDDDDDDAAGEKHFARGRHEHEDEDGDDDGDTFAAPVIQLAQPERDTEDRARLQDIASQENIASQHDFGDDGIDTRLLLLGGAIVCANIRSSLQQQLGYRCSAGISSNRQVSKAMSASYKPNRQAVLFPALACSFLRSQPIAKLQGFGGKLGRRLRTFFGVSLTGDLMGASVAQVTQCMSGDSALAQSIHATIRGHGSSSGLVRNRTAPVSLMSQKAFRPSATTMAMLDRWIVVLAVELAQRITDCRSDFHVVPHSINVKLGSNSLHEYGGVLNVTAALPSGATSGLIRSQVRRMCERSVNWSTQAVNIVTLTATRMSSTGASGAGSNAVQSTLHDFFSSSLTTVTSSVRGNNVGSKAAKMSASAVVVADQSVTKAGAGSSATDPLDLSDDVDGGDVIVTRQQKQQPAVAAAAPQRRQRPERAIAVPKNQSRAMNKASTFVSKVIEVVDDD